MLARALARTQAARFDVERALAMLTAETERANAPAHTLLAERRSHMASVTRTHARARVHAHAHTDMYTHAQHART
jgi:hypothetical protein